MITDIAQRRMRVLVHWEKHGIQSAMNAFNVKKRTLFNWQRSLKEGGGKIEALNPGKREPKDLKAEYPGHVVALDIVERFVHGMRRYVITFEDIYTRFGFEYYLIAGLYCNTI